jgi:hypothetical protein
MQSANSGGKKSCDETIATIGNAVDDEFEIRGAGVMSRGSSCIISVTRSERRRVITFPIESNTKLTQKSA